MRQKWGGMPFTRTHQRSFSYRNRRPFHPRPLGLILLFLGLLIFSEFRLFPFVFFVLPFLFLWFVSRMFFALFRSVTRGVEEFWRDHLETEEDPLLEEQASYSQIEKVPESVRNNET